MVLLVVMTSKMVVRGGREERRKLTIAAIASTRGIAALAGGHNGASELEEKLPVMRRMIMVSLGAIPDCGERELSLWRERSSVVCL